jgi:hypothetical protein
LSLDAPTSSPKRCGDKMKRISLITIFIVGVRIVLANDAVQVIPSAEMEKRPSLWDSETVVDEVGAQRLAAYKGWVYWQKSDADPYVKLLPGICPQWISHHSGQQDRWFYIFLPVGFDGKSELWIGSTRGRYMGRAAKGEFFVNSTPALSPNEKSLATVLRPRCNAAGDTVSVYVILINDRAESPSQERFVFTASGAAITDLRFEDDCTISFMVTQEEGVTQKKIIDMATPQQCPVKHKPQPVD